MITAMMTALQDSSHPLGNYTGSTWRLLLAGLGLLAAMFCPVAAAAQPWADASATTDDPVLATFDGGVVHLSDVQREIRFLGKDERRYRQHEGMALADQWRDWSHRIALRQIALPLAEAEGLSDDPWLREKARQAARDWALDRWRQRCYGLPLVMPDDEALAAELEGEAKTVPPRLRLSHIFLAAEGEDAVSRAVEQLGQWRAQIQDIETFRDYAERLSDSKSAVKGGNLGFLRQGWLPKEAEDILYGLPEGAISEPIVLRGGVHLFFVEKNEPARVMSRQRDINKLRSLKRRQALDACRRERLPESTLQPRGDGTDNGAPVEAVASELRVAEWRLSRQLLQRIYGRPAEELTVTAQRLREREALYQLLLSLGALEPEEELYLKDLEANNLLGALIQSRRGAELVEPGLEALRAHYEAHPDNFKTALLLSLWVAVRQVPEGQDPIAFLASYEALAADLASGRKAWADLAADPPTGLRVERLESVRAFEVGTRFTPLLLSQLAPLAVGSTTGVIQDAADFFIVQITDRQEPRRQSFAEVEEKLRRQVIKKRQSLASAAVVAELLESANFQWTEQGLAHLNRLSSEGSLSSLNVSSGNGR